MKPIQITPQTTTVNLPVNGFDGEPNLTVKLVRVGNPRYNITYPATATPTAVTFAADDNTLKVPAGRYAAVIESKGGKKCKACLPVEIMAVCAGTGLMRR